MRPTCLIALMLLPACFSPGPSPELGGDTDPLEGTTGVEPGPDTGDLPTTTGAQTTDPDPSGSETRGPDDPSTGADTGTTATPVGDTGDTTGELEETGDSGEAGESTESTGETDTTKRVFVSSETYNGSEIADADALCQGLADGAGLGGEWVAWTSTSDMDARDKLTPEAGPYVLLDEAATIIAEDGPDLGDGNLGSAIDIDEHGLPYQQFTAVWTGTSIDGQVDPDTCNDWTTASNEFSGLRGNVTVSGNGWTSIASVGCSGSARIYCFET